MSPKAAIKNNTLPWLWRCYGNYLLINVEDLYSHMTKYTHTLENNIYEVFILLRRTLYLTKIFFEVSIKVWYFFNKNFHIQKWNEKSTPYTGLLRSSLSPAGVESHVRRWLMSLSWSEAASCDVGHGLGTGTAVMSPGGQRVHHHTCPTVHSRWKVRHWAHMGLHQSFSLSCRAGQHDKHF